MASSSEPRRENILRRQAGKAGLTQDGASWLIQALDPFHDIQEHAVGYCDTTASASVVQVVKASYPISCPTGITTGVWDCNVILLPWAAPLTFVPGTALSGNIIHQANPTPVIQLGGVQVVAAVGGTPLHMTTLVPSTTVTNQANVIPSNYLAGNSRIVGMAMEICNTTSDLNRQGLVTVYRTPVPQNDDGTTVNINNTTGADTVNYAGSMTALYIPEPPATIAAAQLFAGTKAWKAADGSYNVAPFNTTDIPAQGLSYVEPVVYQTSQLDSTVYTPYAVRQTGTPATFGYAVLPPVYWAETDIVGSFFTGLSTTTTLTVNVIYYIERFPTQDDLDLIVMAQRSPMYNIQAQEAYSEIMQSLPVAVPFCENDSGGWFDWIADTASSVLGAIPHPYAQAGSVLAKGAKAIFAGKPKDSFDQAASDTSIPMAPPMGAPRRSRNVNASQLKSRKSALKKVVTRENKFENKVRNELKGVGKIVRGKGAPRAPKFK